MDEVFRVFVILMTLEACRKSSRIRTFSSTKRSRESSHFLRSASAGVTVVTAPKGSVHAGVDDRSRAQRFNPCQGRGRSRAQTKKNLVYLASRVPSHRQVLGAIPTRATMYLQTLFTVTHLRVQQHTRARSVDLQSL